MSHILLQSLPTQPKYNRIIGCAWIVSQFSFNTKTKDSQKQLIHFQLQKGRLW